MRPASPRIIRFGYDGHARLASVTNRLGSTTLYAYDGESLRLASITDARGHSAIALTYDNQGRVRTRTDARGQMTGLSSTFDYSPASDGSLTNVERKVPSSLDPSFAPTFTDVYDPNFRLTRQVAQPGPNDDPVVVDWTPISTVLGLQGAQSGGGTSPLSGVTTTVTSGQPGGPAVVVGNPADPVPTPDCVHEPPTGDQLRSGIQWSTGFSTRDPRLDLTTMFGSAGRPTGAATLDAFHRAVAWTDAAGGSWQIKLDDEDEVTAIQSPTGQLATVAYDEVGNVISVQLPDGAVNAFTYDEHDALAEARWGSGVVAHYEYDDRGDLRRANVQQPAGRGTSGAQYWFDGLHRIRRIERYPHWPDLAEARRIEFGYGPDGACSAASS